uniref:Tegument protein UL35 n=1 Tax=Lemniscomys rat herpesvirus TaxID=3141920 RepID=A0AAU7E1Z5_9VIRU
MNFLPNVLRDEDVDYVRELILESDEGVIGALNSGLPMPVYVLESLFVIRVRHRYAKVRQIAEPIVKLAVMCNHYYNSHRIMRNSLLSLRQLFTHQDLERIESGLRRLNRAVNHPENPITLLDTIGSLDMPNGAYEKHLSSVYDLARRAFVQVSDEARRSYPKLGLFNYLYQAPNFTSAEAVETYAENLSNLTRGIDAAPQSLTVRKRSRDPEDVLNDLMYSLSLSHLVVRHQDTLYSLRRWLIIQFSVLCERLYITYTQIPEIRDEFVDVVRQALLLVNQDTEEEEDEFSLEPALVSIFRLLRTVANFDVYVVPDYVRFSTFALIVKIHYAQEVRRNNAESDDEYDVEVDPSSPYLNARYYVNNPYGDPQLFHCPRNVNRYLGRQFVRKTTKQTMLMEYDENFITFEDFELDLHRQLIIEGASRQLKMRPEQLEHYVGLDIRDADVVEPDSRDLFADVRIRQNQRSPAREDRRRRREDGRRYVNLIDVRPYSTDRRRVRRPSGTGHEIVAATTTPELIRRFSETSI